MTSDGIAFAFMTVALQAAGNLPIRATSRKFGSDISSLLSVGSGIIPLVIAIYFLHIPWAINGYSLALLVVCGAFSAIATLTFYKTLETEHLSKSAGLFAIQPAILFLFGVFFLRESITGIDALGAALVFVGVGMVTFRGGFGISKAFKYGILGNILWGLFWVTFSFAIVGVSLPIMQLLVARAVSTTIVSTRTLMIGRIRTRLSREPKLALFGAVGAMLNTIGTVTFSLLIVVNFLALGSVISSLGPALLSGSAYLIYREKLKRIEAAGLVAAFLGAVIIAI